jgi:hypothetical protein
VSGKDDDECRAVAERINNARPQWLVIWGCSSRLYWAFPLFEMHPRALVWGEQPDALVAGMDEAERRFRVWPERGEVSDRDTSDG